MGNLIGFSLELGDNGVSGLYLSRLHEAAKRAEAVFCIAGNLIENFLRLCKAAFLKQNPAKPEMRAFKCGIYLQSAVESCAACVHAALIIQDRSHDGMAFRQIRIE